jgi:Golgi phosphoprotein 3
MSTSDDQLYLHEELLLLALKDAEGTIESRAGMYQYALGGAILSELLLAERVNLTPDKKKLVNFVHGPLLREPILDECLRLIEQGKRRRKATDWVSRFSRIKDLKHRVAQGLCRRRILHASEDRVLWLFTRKVYPEHDPVPEQRIVERLRQAIFSEDPDPDARTVILLALANGAQMLPAHFDKKELKARKKRLQSITDGEVLGAATREAVQAAQAALMVCGIMPAVTAATVTR